MTRDDAVEAITGIPDLEFCEPEAEAQLRAILEQVIESAERRAFDAAWFAQTDGINWEFRDHGPDAQADLLGPAWMAYRQQQDGRQSS